MTTRFRWLAAVGLLVVGCGPSIPNPTGSCEAPDDGSRAGYHSPGGDTWLPDCQNPLRLEYWRVFASAADSAYTMPRLDGERRLAPACADPGHAVAALVQQYGLCAAATTTAEVERVNHMAPADALALTHFLHQQLRFVIADGTTPGIDPYPFPTDVLAACGLHVAANSAELNVICDRERDRLRSGIEPLYFYDGPGAVELVARLNELYGI